MRDACPDCTALAARVALIEQRLAAVGAGLVDAPAAPRKAAPARPALAAMPPKPDSGPDRLRALRPHAWEAGRRAAADGEPATACPYPNGNGGFRGAWLAGHAAQSAPGAEPLPPVTVSRAYAEGRKAGRAGTVGSANPYIDEPRKREQWAQGWRDGKRGSRKSA